MTPQADQAKEDYGVESRKVTKEEAAFILGQGGKTKAKLCAVSGAQIDLVEGKGDRSAGSSLQLRGTTKQRLYARKYVEFVIAQRLGPVKIDNPEAHDDLTILVVPADTVSFITGKAGSFLRLVEEEWGALLFFLQVNPKNPPIHVDPSHTERLAIFGPTERGRRGAELKVMAAIEMKLPQYFTKNLQATASPREGFATDTLLIKEEDYSYALGKLGSTRKKLARASSCIVEYVGRVAHFCGTRKERVCAKEYLQWLLQQRVGEHVKVDHKGREDVTMIMVPSSCIGFVTGHRGSSLRSIEEETSTFCFIEGAADDGEDPKPLLIFGCAEDRRVAETLVLDKISMKFDENGGDSYSWGYGYGYGDSRGEKGYRRGKGKGKGGDKGDSKGKRNYNRDYGPSWAPRGSCNEAAEERAVRKDASTETMALTDDDAAFLMGPGGRTKKKIAAVSGAYLELKNGGLEIIGTNEEREKAKKYIELVMAQRIGPVRLEDVDQHPDLSIIEVPAEAVSFVTGRQGSFLRLVEEEFGTLLFFIDFNKSNKRDQLERLAIFGPLRERRGAELKVMAAIEMKQPGYFTRRDAQLPMEDPTDAFGTDRMPIDEDDYSYALGKGGATRKKIARASGCVIEYIGRLAYLSGDKKERVRAREYLGWLKQQRVGPVEVDYTCRNDVTVLQVPKDCVGFVTGHKGTSLRAVEDATGTFCFIEGGRDDPHRDPKPLLVFGCPEARRQAEDRLRQRIDQKLVEGWVHEDYFGYDTGRPGDKGGGRHHNGGGRRPGRGGGGRGASANTATYTPDDRSSNNNNNPGPSPSAAAPVTPSATGEHAVEQEDDGAWGDWGGSSDDEDKNAAPAAAAAAAAPAATTPSSSSVPAAGVPEAKVPGTTGLLTGASGKWTSGAAGAYMPAAAASAPSAATAAYSGSVGSAVAHSASPQRGGVGSTSPAYSPSAKGGEELELPPQLLHEEAWPELGQTGSSKKGRR